MYNWDNQEYFYEKEKLEEAIKSKNILVLLLDEKKVACEKLEEENKNLKQRVVQSKKGNDLKNMKRWNVVFESQIRII